jgi:DNA polymerase-1
MSDDKRPILVVDAMNMFVRAFCSYPTVSSLTGQQMGGAIGFCKMLGKICDIIKPRMIYVCWEGGGSAKRRKIYSEYKMNRTPEKLNRFYEDDIPESDENRKYQIMFLLALLKKVPVCQLYVSDCEGDDVVSYLCRGQLRNEYKVIASSDKDLYQLMDEKTQIYNLHRKTIMTQESVFEEFRVYAHNFAIAKCICGDASDNIPGVKGMGYKTLMKHVPFLGLEQQYLLEDVFSYCSTHQDNKHCKRILESQDDIKRNWRLIYLDDHTLTNEQAKKIDYVIENFQPKMNKIEFMKLLAKEGINSFDPTWFFYSLNSIENIQY